MGWVRRRVVSVVFADLVGFTELGDRLDPEDVEVVQQRYFAAARTAVEAHGGEVEKYIGDAVVAGFGIRDRADDAAVRAVRAAVAIRDAVADLEAALDWLDTPLRVRVGVDTGEVVVADDGTEWRLTGDTVNVAARLQAAAAPGDVLVGAETMLAASASIPLEAIGALELKGRRGRTRAWRVAAGPAPRPALPRTPLVGRDLELAELRARIDAGAAGLLVTGAPGLGRSRLLDALARRRTSRAVVQVSVRSGADAPYAAVGDLLRLAARAAAPDATGTLTELAGRAASPLVATGLGAAAAALAGDPFPAGRGELFTAWSAALDHLLPPPSLLLIDDVHLAAADARSFVAHLVSEQVPGRCVVTTSRAAAAVGDGERFGDAIHLGPLSRPAMTTLIDALLGDDVLPPEVRDRILTAAGGTPLYVVELLRRWVRDDILRPEGDGWRITDADRSPQVPTTVQALYTGELDHLPERPRRVVSVASVPGQRFPPAVLPTLGVDDPRPALAALLAAGLLRPVADGAVERGRSQPRYAFRHPLLRDVAYGELLRRERAELHLRYATWLEETGDAPPAEVAAHLDAARAAWPRTGDDPRFDPAELGEQAAARWERAARDDLRSAPERAAERAQRAVALGRSEHRSRRLLLVADAQRRLGALGDAADLLAEAAEAAIQVGSDEDLVTAALGHEIVVHAGRVDREGPVGRRGRALLGTALDRTDPRDRSTRARLLAARGQARAWAGDDDGADDLDRAVSLARASHDPDALAVALVASRAVRRDPEHLRQRLDAAREAAAAADRAAAPELAFEAERLLLVDLLEAGEVAEADTVRRRAAGRVRDLRIPGLWWYPAMWEAMERLRVGDLEHAEHAIDRFREVATRGRYRDAELVVLAQQLQLRLDQGRHEDVRELAARAWAADPARWAGTVAGAAATAGDPGLADAGLTWHLERGLRAVPEDLSRAYVLAGLAEAASVVGDASAAADLHRHLEPWRGHAIVLGSGALCLGVADRYLGLLEQVLGRTAAAHASLRAANVHDRASGATPAATRAERALAALSHDPPTPCA